MKIEGGITDNNQKPLSGVTVEFFDGGTLIAAVRSGTDGRFKFENDAVFPDHPIQVKASAKGYLSAEQAVAQDGASGLALVLHPVEAVPPPPGLGKYIVGAAVVLVLGAALFFAFRSRSPAAVPELELTLSSPTVQVGELFTLKWTSKNAERVAIHPLGEFSATGNTSFVAQAAGSTNYKGVAAGNGKSSQPVEVTLTVQASPQALLRITKVRLNSSAIQKGTQPTLFVTIQNVGNKPSGPLILRVSARKPGVFGSLSDETVSSLPVIAATTATAERVNTPVSSELARASASASHISGAASGRLHEGILVPAHAGVAIDREIIVAPFRPGHSLDLAFTGTIAPQQSPELSFKLWSDLPIGKWNISAGLVANGNNYAIGATAPGVKAQALTVKE